MDGNKLIWISDKWKYSRQKLKWTKEINVGVGVCVGGGWVSETERDTDHI